MLEFAAPFGGVGQVAVVAQGDFAFIAIDHDGLGVEQGFVAGRGIARVTDRNIARKLGEHGRDEDFFDFPHGAVGVELATVDWRQCRRIPGRDAAAHKVRDT